MALGIFFSVNDHMSYPTYSNSSIYVSPDNANIKF